MLKSQPTVKNTFRVGRKKAKKCFQNEFQFVFFQEKPKRGLKKEKCGRKWKPVRPKTLLGGKKWRWLRGVESKRQEASRTNCRNRYFCPPFLLNSLFAFAPAPFVGALFQFSVGAECPPRLNPFILKCSFDEKVRFYLFYFYWGDFPKPCFCPDDDPLPLPLQHQQLVEQRHFGR
jgi:hypothetical protein